MQEGPKLLWWRIHLLALAKAPHLTSVAICFFVTTLCATGIWALLAQVVVYPLLIGFSAIKAQYLTNIFMDSLGPGSPGPLQEMGHGYSDYSDILGRGIKGNHWESLARSWRARTQLTPSQWRLGSKAKRGRRRWSQPYRCLGRSIWYLHIFTTLIYIDHIYISHIFTCVSMFQPYIVCRLYVVDKWVLAFRGKRHAETAILSWFCSGFFACLPGDILWSGILFHCRGRWPWLHHRFLGGFALDDHRSELRFPAGWSSCGPLVSTWVAIWICQPSSTGHPSHWTTQRNEMDTLNRSRPVNLGSDCGGCTGLVWAPRSALGSASNPFNGCGISGCGIRTSEALFPNSEAPGIVSLHLMLWAGHSAGLWDCSSYNAVWRQILLLVDCCVVAVNVNAITAVIFMLLLVTLFQDLILIQITVDFHLLTLVVTMATMAFDCPWVPSQGWCLHSLETIRTISWMNHSLSRRQRVVASTQRTEHLGIPLVSGPIPSAIWCSGTLGYCDMICDMWYVGLCGHFASRSPCFLFWYRMHDDILFQTFYTYTYIYIYICRSMPHVFSSFGVWQNSCHVAGTLRHSS